MTLTLERYFSLIEVYEQTIQELVKQYANEIFQNFKMPDIIGMHVSLPVKRKESLQYLLEYKNEPYLKDYFTIFVNKDLEIVNSKLYQTYVPELADLLSTLHEKILELLNAPYNVNDSSDNHERLLHYYNIDLDIIRGFYNIDTKEQIQYVIKIIELYTDIITYYDQYKQLYEVEMLGG